MLPHNDGHLRKYLATLGVAVVAGVVSVSALTLRLQDDLLVKESDLAQLTPTARETIERRQDLLAATTTALPWFFVLGTGGGIALSVYGLLGWAERQRVQDRIEDTTAERAAFEFGQLSQTDLERKRDREVEAAGAGDAQAATPRRPSTPDAVTGLRDRVTASERTFLEKLTDLFRARGADVVPGIRATGPGGDAEFDAFVVDPLTGDACVFELRYLVRQATLERRVKDTLDQVAGAAARVGGIDRALLVVVVPNRIEIPEALQSGLTVPGAVQGRAVVLTEDELSALTPTGLATLLGLTVRVKRRSRTASRPSP